MKNYLKCFIVSFILKVILFPLNGISQITINSGDIPVNAGFELTMSQADFDTLPFDVEAAGPNYVWDFSQADTITWDGSFTQTNVDAPTPYPNVNFITNRTIEYVPGVNMIFQQHMILSDASLLYKGTKWFADGVQDTTLFENEPELMIYQFPMTYQSAWSSTVTKSQYKNGVLQESHQRTLERTVDGWGLLKLPGQNYECLRIKEFDTESDTDTSYFWMAKNGVNLLTAFSVETNDDGSKEGSIYYCEAPLSVIEAEDGPKVPEQFILSQNYPNPFNPVTNIKYQVGADRSSPVHVDLSIYNSLGQKVSVLVSGNRPAGKYEVKWNAEGLPSGVYFYKIQAGAFTQVRKMILLK
jgi:hypothetical protein